MVLAGSKRRNALHKNNYVAERVTYSTPSTVIYMVVLTKQSWYCKLSVFCSTICTTDSTNHPIENFTCCIPAKQSLLLASGGLHKLAEF